MAPREILTGSENETREAGLALARDLQAGDIILIEGHLGMGKTVFARGLAEGLGVDPAEVRSPSFTLINPYRGRVPVYHVDLYRIDRESDLDELGLEEILGGDGVAIVEWAERLGPWRPQAAVLVRIEDRGGSRRRLVIDDARGRDGGAAPRDPALPGSYSNR